MSLLTSQILSENEKRKISFGEFKSSNGEDKIYFKSNSPIEFGQGPIHLILLHDLGEYHIRYLDIGHYLINEFGNKLSVTWIDLPGHGFSGGTRAHIDDFDRYCEDVGFFVRELQDREKGEVLLLGQGLGAVIAIKLHQFFFHLLRRPLGGLILANPALKFRWELPRWMRSFMGGWQGSLSKLKLPFQLEGKMLSRDQSQVESYDSDPLISHTISIGLFNELSRAGSIVRTSSYFLDIATLVLISGQDGLYQSQVTRLFAKGMCRELGQIIDYPNCRHDLFNEVKRDIVFKDIYNWIKELS